MKQWKTDNFISPPNALERTGYDEYFILKSDTKIDEDPLDGISSGDSYTKIRNAFKNGYQKKSASKTMLNRFTDLIAV